MFSISLPTSAIRHIAGRLCQQIVIQFDDSVAEGEAFGLDSVRNLTHVRLCKMDDGRCLM
jgi:hypothetical protein